MSDRRDCGYPERKLADLRGPERTATPDEIRIPRYEHWNKARSLQVVQQRDNIILAV